MCSMRPLLARRMIALKRSSRGNGLICICMRVQGLRQMSALDVPIYITETGIADAVGDRRPLWLETYIPEVERAVRDGLDVRGLMYWTLVDNFEVSPFLQLPLLSYISAGLKLPCAASCTGCSWTTSRRARMPKHVLKDSSLLSLSDHQSLNEMA